MDYTNVSLWYDPEGDFLEVIWEIKEGYFRETEDDRVMVKIDNDNNVLGFHILGVSGIKGGPFEVALDLDKGACEKPTYHPSTSSG
jgi:uncharacterized protein YuzE